MTATRPKTLYDMLDIDSSLRDLAVELFRQMAEDHALEGLREDLGVSRLVHSSSPF